MALHTTAVFGAATSPGPPGVAADKRGEQRARAGGPLQRTHRRGLVSVRTRRGGAGVLELLLGEHVRGYDLAELGFGRVVALGCPLDLHLESGELLAQLVRPL